MKIKYLVPQPALKGGIQDFANSIRLQVEKSSDIEIAVRDYAFQLPKLGEKLVPRLPNSWRRSIADRWVVPVMQQQNHFSAREYYHCWHLDTAFYLPRGTAFIVSVHGLEILPKWLQESWFKWEYARQALQRAKAITCTSRYTRKLLISTFPELETSKMVITYPPIMMDEFHIQQKSRQHVRMIGTLCRLVPRKNVATIISALTILYEQDPHFEYVLAGEGPQKEALLADLANVPFKWRYLGAISDQEKKKIFFPSLDVFIMPTLASADDVEGFGIVYLEAAAAGVPVISAPSGGATEAIKPGVTGEFTDPRDPHAMAQTLQKVLHHQYSRQAMRAWVRQFDVSHVAAEFIDLYRQFFPES